MFSYQKPASLSDRRGSAFAHDELSLNNSVNPVKAAQTRPSRGPPTPCLTTPAAEYDQTMTGSPPPPPTPAASPGPSHVKPDWVDAGADDGFLDSKIQQHFKSCSGPQKTRLLADLLKLCTSHELSFVHQFVSPLLKKDPFTSLPNELCLRILSFIDDPKVLARASQVSRRWRDLLSDDVTWKNLCVKHDYERHLSEVESAAPSTPVREATPTTFPLSISDSENPTHNMPSLVPDEHSVPMATSRSLDGGGSTTTSRSPSIGRNRSQCRSYKSHFKQRFLVDAAWRTGGQTITKNITQDGGLVTSLHLTSKYIIVALDNARIYVFDTKGENQKTLQGHVMGVWAMVPWDDMLVSGGCDRDVRVWDLTTGQCVHTLRGHTSTVRCLKMSDENTAISGSRDTMLRVWDVRTGLCKNVLTGHQASVRCLEVHGDIVVSGSYDTTARIWSISEGRCLHTLQGHYSQIYAIAFDGTKVATGSLDTSVRIWNAATGECQAVLQGHTSLVGQLQMRGDTLVTGGSDGSVRVWSLSRFCPIHRLAAHDNSVTSLQFDDTRVVSGGSDGRVKVWDLKTGQMVRELISYGEAVWRVAFEDEKCVAMALRSGRTVMEVWSFSPPTDVSSDRPSLVPQLSWEAPVSSASTSSQSPALATALSTAQNLEAGMDLELRRLRQQDMTRQGSTGDDIAMRDAGPATVSLPPGSSTFTDDD
ncbi:hypothetical protein SEPCBS57363_004888 [Sporothrix epigloea]|uniref:F-box domain-containing protein n=1 Tax=Sporothrix epigloea TaxID=1892477 RepID=A0ABP0DUI4_9PEZI